MQTSIVSQTVQLLDGRTLGYAEYGSADGVSVFYFTGGNSSRFERGSDSSILFAC